jgi:hypothetical protein
MELIRDPADGAVLDALTTMYPAQLEVHQRGKSFSRPASTTYGYVVSGRAHVASAGLEAACPAGSFFAIPGELELRIEGMAVTIERVGFRGLAQVGLIEGTGRLTYIDGCSDTILVAPPRLGDPVLNHLHFPAGITQSVHCHPSVRLGVVARGRGVAYGPAPEGGKWEAELAPGSVFLLHAQALHAFRTEAREALDVIAFHPDSDWGPTDGDHPMLNRTYPASRPRLNLG